MRFLNPIKKKVPGTDVDAINNAPNKFISKYRMLTTIEEKEKALGFYFLEIKEWRP